VANKNSEDKPIEEQKKVNRASEDQDKIVIKRYEFPGVDMSVNDFEMLSSVKIGVTKVTKKMYKKWKQTFIGTKDQLDDGDVIQVGNLDLKYRVLKHHKITDREGYIYRVRRVDNANTTGLDINNIEVGMKVKIVNRKTFEQLMNYPDELMNVPEDCNTYCEEDAVVCDTRTPATVQGFPAGSYQASVANNPCVLIEITVAQFTSASTTFLNCNLEEEEIFHITGKQTLPYIICTKDPNSLVHNGFTPVSVVVGGEC
jgi:hypothetical protein